MGCATVSAGFLVQPYGRFFRPRHAQDHRHGHRQHARTDLLMQQGCGQSQAEEGLQQLQLTHRDTALGRAAVLEQRVRDLEDICKYKEQVNEDLRRLSRPGYSRLSDDCFWPLFACHDRSRLQLDAKSRPNLY